MKILFLDIDGVLNSLDSSHKLGTLHKFAPKSIKALNDVLKATGAVIVISSSWRFSHSYQEMEDLLQEQGVKCRVVGQTPFNAPDSATGLYTDVCVRGDEILELSLIHI